MIALYWTLAALIAFSLAGYGLLWIGLARLTGARPQPPEVSRRATVLVTAQDDPAGVAAKVGSVLAQETGPCDVDILVVADGSGEATADALANLNDPSVTVITLTGVADRATAVSAGLARIPASHAVIFSDAGSVLKPGALRQLLRPFADPLTGGSIGRLEIPAGSTASHPAGRLARRWQDALATAEDRLGGAMPVAGALYAVRRSLIGHLSPAVSGDLAIALGAVDRGFRLAYVPGAVAVAPAGAHMGDTLGGRARAAERAWRALMAHARLLNPLRAGLFAVQLFCRAALGGVVGFLLLLLLAVNLGLADHGALYALTAAAQLAFYAAATLAFAWRRAGGRPGAPAATRIAFGHLATAWGVVRATGARRAVLAAPMQATAVVERSRENV